MLDLERFIDDCRRSLAGVHVERAVRELVERVVAEPRALRQALGEPERAGIQALHRSAQLTILNVTWAPGMSVMPHDHRMWAVIGIYSGREDNVFWHLRRLSLAIDAYR
jgi:predicted metal-dependent enzyme (double-stranded beta helix superfamily)